MGASNPYLHPFVSLLQLGGSLVDAIGGHAVNVNSGSMVRGYYIC